MKTLKLIIASVVALVFTLSSSFAQNYKQQFPSVDSKGTIKDNSGTTLGTVSKVGIIKNQKGEKVAFVDSNGNLVDKDGKVLGKAEKNGIFHNINGEIEYTVKPSKGEQCEVYDKGGKVVASVHDSYKMQAECVAHCLQTKMLMK
jgi:hypothetical protein